jgi:hypothetical protein
MTILLVSQGEVLNPEWEADRQRARDRVVKLRAEAIGHDRRGMVLFANECRRRARMQENLFDLVPAATAEPGDDTQRHPPMVEMALAGLRNGAERRHQ